MSLGTALSQEAEPNHQNDSGTRKQTVRLTGGEVGGSSACVYSDGLL
jgi:hypothetical protein